MQHYDKFSKVHALLKEYGCKPMYPQVSNRDYNEKPEVDIFFYEPFEHVKTKDGFNKQWEEHIDAELDTVVKTKIQGADHQEIRFCLTYSVRAKRYSLFISLPTHGRSIVLAKDIYKVQNEVFNEIQKWLITAKCKKVKAVEKESDIVKPAKGFEQLTLI
jgi:hypothetical protein